MARTRNAEIETLRTAEEDGNSFASALLKDRLEDEGCYPPAIDKEDGIPVHRQLKRGDWCVIWTATHCYRGQLVGLDHEEYVLWNVTQVFDSGEPEELYLNGTASQSSEVPCLHRIRRGGVIAVVDIACPPQKAGGRNNSTYGIAPAKK